MPIAQLDIDSGTSSKALCPAHNLSSFVANDRITTMEYGVGIQVCKALFKSIKLCTCLLVVAQDCLLHSLAEGAEQTVAFD